MITLTQEQDDARLKEIQAKLNELEAQDPSSLTNEDLLQINSFTKELFEINKRAQDYIDKEINGVLGKTQRETNPAAYWFWRSWIAVKMYGANWIKLIVSVFIGITIAVPVSKLAYNYIKILWAIW